MRTILNEQVRRYTTSTISTTSGEFGMTAFDAEFLELLSSGAGSLR